MTRVVYWDDSRTSLRQSSLHLQIQRTGVEVFLTIAEKVVQPLERRDGSQMTF